MAVRIIGYDVTLATVLTENATTIGLLATHALAQPFVAACDAFHLDWIKVNGARTALVIAQAKADGAYTGTDDEVDDVVDQVDRTLLIAVKNDRKAPIYQHYFGVKTAAPLKRPVHKEELATVRLWIPSLQASPVASLAAIAPVLVAAVAAADIAVPGKAAADQALKDFDHIGAKKALIDQFNILRKEIYGKLSQIPHANPAAALPLSFADRFFLHEKPRAPVVKSNDPVEIQARIDAAQKKIVELQAEVAADGAALKLHQTAEEQKKALDAELAAAKIAEDGAVKTVRDLEHQVKLALDKAKQTVG